MSQPIEPGDQVIGHKDGHWFGIIGSVDNIRSWDNEDEILSITIVYGANLYKVGEPLGVWLSHFHRYMP